MSYHSTLGAGFSVSASATFDPTRPPKACPDGTRPTWSKTGWSCPRSSGSAVSQPVATPVPKTQPQSAPTATAAPTPQAVKYGSLLWSESHQVAAPTKTYTKVTPSPVRSDDAYRTEATQAAQAAAHASGMNWLPWALGAAGLGLVLFLARRRSA